MPRVTLIGSRGTGKSTVGERVAQRLGVEFVDADLALEQRCGMTIAQLVRERGEGAFRDMESALLAELLERCTGVLATGGGVVVRPANRELLRRRGRPVVWLSAPADVVRSRLTADPATLSRRPPLVGADPLTEIEVVLREREPLYRQTADAIVEASASPEEVTAQIMDLLAGGGEVAP